MNVFFYCCDKKNGSRFYFWRIQVLCDVIKVRSIIGLYKDCFYVFTKFYVGINVKVSMLWNSEIIKNYILHFSWFFLFNYHRESKEILNLILLTLRRNEKRKYMNIILCEKFISVLLSNRFTYQYIDTEHYKINFQI